jgi:hypothetical protein
MPFVELAVYLKFNIDNYQPFCSIIYIDLVLWTGYGKGPKIGDRTLTLAPAGLLLAELKEVVRLRLTLELH